MATNVDPRIYPIPLALQKDPEVRKYFEDFERWAHDMWIRSGAGTDAIAPVVSDSNRKADTLLYAVLDKISLGNPVTIDTTGFTIDTTHQFTDLTES
jgi:hypothetical protein